MTVIRLYLKMLELAQTQPTKQSKVDPSDLAHTPPTKKAKMNPGSTQKSKPESIPSPTVTAIKLPIEVGDFALPQNSIRRGNPSFSHEGTRHQYLARTGYSGVGQSLKFRYGSGEDYKCKDDAKKACLEWVKAMSSK